MAIPPFDPVGTGSFGENKPDREQQVKDRLHAEAVRLTERETGTTLANLHCLGKSTTGWRAAYNRHRANLDAELAAARAVVQVVVDAAEANLAKLTQRQGATKRDL